MQCFQILDLSLTVFQKSSITITVSRLIVIISIPPDLFCPLPPLKIYPPILLGTEEYTT